MLKAEVNEMVMKRMMKTEDDKLVMFRQQTAIVANKKMSLVEKIRESRSELASLKEDIDERRASLQKLQGDVTMNEEEFKEYVKSLRVKSTRYKQMKAQLAYLKSESGILAKTVFILTQDVKNSEIHLVTGN
jgi:chromosome segregation ATPase